MVNNGANKNQVFAYPIEAPRGATDNGDKNNSASYNCIHNIVNEADIVPLFGPASMGFKRYGVDHSIPGSNVGSMRTNTFTVHRAGDNSSTYTYTRSYDTANGLMLPSFVLNAGRIMSNHYPESHLGLGLGSGFGPFSQKR